MTYDGEDYDYGEDFEIFALNQDYESMQRDADEQRAYDRYNEALVLDAHPSGFKQWLDLVPYLTTNKGSTVRRASQKQRDFLCLSDTTRGVSELYCYWNNEVVMFKWITDA